jgi:predicted transcriptional regulator
MAIDKNVTRVSFEVLSMEDSSCWRLARILDTMFRDPSYQRQGSIWTTGRKQAFIDSLLNGFDVPKIYLHEGGLERESKRYAIVDGKQRLETLAEFYTGRLKLSSDFKLFNVGKIEELGLTEADAGSLGGKTYQELEVAAPAVSKYLDQRKLDVKIIRTEDLDVIEEMFWRLNEAATLNGPEHRRGIGGQAIKAIDEVVAHQFFECLPFGDRRYRHQDLAAKMLLWSAPAKLRYASGPRGDIPDTKKLNLDRFVVVVRDAESSMSKELLAEFAAAKAACTTTLDSLQSRYTESDKTLARLGTVAVVFLQALRASQGAGVLSDAITKKELLEFDRYREETVRKFAEGDDVPVGAIAMVDYGTLAQSSNDGSALLRRVSILEAYVAAARVGEDPLVQLADI